MEAGCILNERAVGLAVEGRQSSRLILVAFSDGAAAGIPEILLL